MRRTFTLACTLFRRLGPLLFSWGILLLPLTQGQAQTLPPGEGQVADSTELRVLRQFYQATGGPQWSNSTNWLQGTTLSEAATWAGVGVDQGDVTSLSFFNNQLRGPLPASLGQLTQLRYLDLSANQLTGPLPASLGQLTQLLELQVSGNRLTGSLPPELGHCAQLQSFGADNNQLTGPLPASLGNWVHMSWLSITDNQLTGPLPASWGRMQALFALSLRNNQLSGPLPDSLANCQQLSLLNLFNNRFTDSLPASWGRLRHLSSLDLAANQLSGPLPDALTQLTELGSLSLAGNQLQGPLPDHWERLRSLAGLSLSNNQLTGPLPASFGALPALRYCSLDGNQLTGPLPAPTGAGWRQLFYLDVRHNQLSGALPDSLGHCQQLDILQLGWNQFSGPLPATLGQCTSLRELHALNNALTGPLPASLGQLPRLQLLDLRSNQLSGTVPGAWGQLGQLQQLSLSYNHLQGPLPDALGQLPQLGYLDLGQNQLTGALPAAWRGMRSLQLLSVQDNQLSGALPDSLAVPYLYVDRNQFSGPVPAFYAASPTLLAFTLEDNHFTQLPDFNASPHLSQLRLSISDNWLEFDSYERNQHTPDPGQWYWWNYSRTQRQPPADTLQVLPGRAVQLDGKLGGQYNHYQWQRLVGGQWTDMPGLTTSRLGWAAVTPAEAGSYRTRVVNDWVAGITLYSRPHVLDVVPYRALAQNRPDDTNQGLAARPLVQADSAAWHSAAAPPDVNYVRVWTPRVALTDSTRVPGAPVDSVSMSTQYLDGLGRPVQTVLKQASPQRRDMVQPQAYDGLGREPRAYLPYPDQQNGNGGYRPQALRQQHGFYFPDSSPNPPAPDDPTRGVARTGVAFAETQFEASPLGRVTAQSAPGEAWQLTGGHIVEHVERPNTAQDSVLWFVPGYDPLSLDPGYRGCYAPGELWGSQHRDEHGFYSLEWKDKLGQVVGKQVQAARLDSAGYRDSTGTQARRWLRTAYVYDDFQRLRFVLQPEGTKRLLTSLTAPVSTGLTREQWDNVPGSNIGDIPLNQAPTSLSILPTLEGPTNLVTAAGADFAYADRNRGYLLAPQDGAYTFWLASDDNGELWLSTDELPAHKQRIAWIPGGWTYPREWSRYAQQQSAPVQLVAGQRYYLEVLHKEWGGGDNMAVTWQLPDGTGFGTPIPGQYLAPYQAQLLVAQQIAPYLFHYRYDGRGRQIAKQVPGQDGETLVVYDQLDRPVLSQDASQRQRQEWSWTKYDALGRLVLSGLTSRQDTMSQVSLQALAAADTLASHQYEQRTADAAHYPQFLTTDQSFPQLGQGTLPSAQGFAAGQVLSATYYDDYDFNNDGQADLGYDTSLDGQFASGQAPVADALRTTGLTTQTRTRVLGVAETDAVQAAWLTTTTFYDERARPVQVQTSNARKYGDYQQGRDVLTTQLDFTGKVVQSVASHQGPNLDKPLLVKEQFRYDHTGRLLTTHQQLPGETQPALLDSVSYNEIGQVVRKSLGSGRLRQDVDYAYNIRGWLTSLNDPYFPVAADLFNLSLHYEAGFTTGYEQYNGNLTGQTWRGRDGVQRAYGYVYDATNRLLQGDFVARQTTTAATPGAGAWTAEQDNYRLSFVSYDDNGNILTLRRRGLLQNATHARSKQYGAVDNLTYAYQGNRLQAVDDQVTGNQLPRPTGYNGAPTSLAGDFQEAGVKLGQEYLYDANGNLTQDKNKGITGILYNHLNLPRQIHFGQVGDSVVFRYTASGQKVAKLVYQTGKPTPQRTDYLGPYQYEGDSLRFFPHAEGRVLRFVSYDAAHQATVSFQREFTFKDHLGNLRLAYRLGQTRTYLATLEQDSTTRKRETQQFDSLSVSQPIAVATPWAMGQYAARLNAGGASPQPLGPLTQLTVQKGDFVQVSAPGLYPQKVGNSSFAFSLASFVAGLLQPAPAGTPPGADGSRRGGLPLLQVGLNAATLTAVSQLASGVPKGYLRVLVFNQDSMLLPDQSRTVQLSTNALNNYEVLSDTLTIRQNGYVSVYVGNESPVDVFFDELRVEHRQGLQVQENQYDPAGLELAGLAAPSPGIRGLNNYRFNGKEFQADLGLAWNHQDWRFFDPQLLRWHVGDPEIENKQESWTPYSFGYDNTIRYSDSNGRCPCEDKTPPSPGKQYVSSFAKTLATDVVGAVYNTATDPLGTIVNTVVIGVQNNLDPVTFYKGLYNSSKKLISNNHKVAGAAMAGLFFAVGSVIIPGGEGEAAAEVGAAGGAEFSGTSRAWAEGATPNSIYTQLSSDGKVAVQNTIYNTEGKAIHQVDFKNHGKGAKSGHGHNMTTPGEIGTGHQHTPGSFVPHTQVPSSHQAIPPGTKPSQPIGQ